MDMGSQSLVSACRVERGIYALRYVAADDRPFARADVTVRAGEIAFVSAPGRSAGELTAPGTVLVLVVETAGEFEIRVSATAGGSTDARFSLDLLDGGEDLQRRRPEFDVDRPTARPRSADPAGRRGDDAVNLSVLAHVSRRGDVRVGADEWVAGPNEVLPIEGLAIVAGRRDVGIRMRVQSRSSEGRWSRWHDPEDFAGSRQKADPLTGIALALAGEAAPQFEIEADVMALGAPLWTEKGRSIEFLGFDPIVGFRLRLNPVKADVQPVASPAASPLRVFRAKR